MSDGFEIAIQYKGQLCTFQGDLYASHFTHWMLIDIYGVKVKLEVDENRKYRAIVQPEKLNSVDPILLKLIAEKIEEIIHG